MACQWPAFQVNHGSVSPPLALKEAGLSKHLPEYTDLSQTTMVDEDLNTIKPQGMQKKRVQYKLVKHRFLKSHPLYDTHHTVLRPECEQSVPNFVDGMLPRKDVGDCEYYCLTMLTLFRPWHRGKDLKIENISWDTSFINFKLLPWQDKIISNFNLQYECMDAKDDYNA